MSLLRIAVLGSPEVFHGEDRLIFSLRKALALLLYLAVEGGMHSRSKLAALLWPDSNPHDARTALRNAIALLRTLLADSDASSPERAHLLSEHDLLGLNPRAALELDLQQVQRAWKQARELSAFPAEELRASLIGDWQEALSQARGPFLDGFWLREESSFNEWLQSQQRQWQMRLQLLFDRLSSWQEAAGETEQAIATLIRWQTLNPLHEEAYRRLMRLYLAQGDPSAALQVYTTCRTRLADELQVAPAPETTALFEHIRATNGVTTIPFSYHVESNTVLPPNENELAIPFVGRVTDFKQLVSSYKRARQGQPGAAMLIGEAGIGKTRLASEFASWARQQGADVLSGQAFEMGERLPYQLLVEAIRPRLDEENAPEDLLDDAWLAELARILPELRVRYPDLPVPAEDEVTARVRLFEAVARLLDALARQAPLALFLDDLHWADEASLDLIRYLARYWRAHHTQALLVGTVRSEELELNRTHMTQLADLERDLPLVQVTLQPLSKREAQDLVQAFLTKNEQKGHKQGEYTTDRSPSAPAMAVASPIRKVSPNMLDQHLFTLTGGHPFYLLETLKMLHERGLLTPCLEDNARESRAHATATPPAVVQQYSWRELLPPSVRAMILARQALLSPHARQVVMACAVLDEYATAQRIWWLTDLGVPEGVDALEEAISSGVLCEEQLGVSHPSRYRFTHNLIREVVYTEIGEARRQALHRRAFLLLHAEGVPAPYLAYHALAAGEASEAYKYSVQAGDEAISVSAVENAITYFDQRFFKAL